MNEKENTNRDNMAPVPAGVSAMAEALKGCGEAGCMKMVVNTGRGKSRSRSGGSGSVGVGVGGVGVETGSLLSVALGSYR